tara:strand:+ start:7152 stop:7283 length:132 start_codon:yes stop_codon:yes gene_type:complete
MLYRLLAVKLITVVMRYDTIIVHGIAKKAHSGTCEKECARVIV